MHLGEGALTWISRIVSTFGFWLTKCLLLKTVAAVTVSMLLVVGARAQSNGNNPVRDAAAIALLQNSVAAMGGSSAWNSVQDWTITGTFSSTSAQSNANFSWKGSGNEFRFEVDTGQTANVFVSGYGTPARIVNGTSTPINYHVARSNPPYHLPALRLQQELNNAQLTINYLGATALQGRPAIQVHVSDDSDAVGSLVTPHEWYFDPVSFLPLHVTFRLPANGNAENYLNGAFDFAQFQQINGMLVPFQLQFSKDNSPAKSFLVGSVAFNSGLPASTFSSSAGAN